MGETKGKRGKEYLFFLIGIFIFIILFNSNFISALNESTYYLHNETDSQYTSYSKMLNQSTDTGMATSQPAQLPNNLITCWSTKWLAPSWTLNTQVNGTWNFSIYTNTTANFAVNQYFLFAKIIKKNSSGEFNPLNTSLAGFAVVGNSAPIARNWSYAVPFSNDLNLSVGEKIGVQVCVDVTGGGATNKFGYMSWENNAPSFVKIPFNSFGNPPVFDNISASSNLLKGGNILTIYANTSLNGVNDSQGDTLYLYCGNTTTPNATNTDCTGGTTVDSTYPYALSCTFATSTIEANYTEYCRLYDGTAYSINAPNVTYAIDSTPPTTSVISVAGDTTPSYIDNVNDGRTDILVSGESNMSCRWSSSDVTYSSMSNDCAINGTQANCSVNDVASQGFFTRYVSCKDFLGNEQNTSQNLNVQFYLDYTPPTTTSNANTDIHAPNYTVTITELDNVDSNPLTYYCTSTSPGCNPLTPIDNGGTITYTSSDRGTNYLRFYSVDFAGNIQTVVNQTININRLPIFTSASSDAGIIKGGSTVNVSSIAYDLDAQTLSFYVCKSAGATISGCTGLEYCSSSGISNLSCTFTSETDSSTHTWYAYIFDPTGEAATTNPLTGSYTTDSTAPTITLANPLNNSTLTQNSVTLTIVVSEPLTNAWYSLNSGVNNVSMNNNSLYLYTNSNTSIANGNYNISIWANDSYGNIGSLFGNSFTIDSTLGDITPPVITIWNPVNNSYSSSSSVLLNITSDEALSWAGYKTDSGTIITLGNVSATDWNATISLTEGQHNITFYANDSSTNKNKANKSSFIYVDLTNPQVLNFACTTPINNSINVNCSANVSDSVGLNYAIIGYNATGIWQNSSPIYLTGNSATLSYIISAGNTTPGSFGAGIYLYDLSGRNNLTSSSTVNVLDDSAPSIYNITYLPNTIAGLDPGVTVNVNATIVEDYQISSVSLMYRNSSSPNWTSVIMSNNSAIANGSSATTIYNASFVPQTETWYLQINATDAAGNQNISSNYTLIVQNDTTQNISTSIPDIESFTYAQRADNNSLGTLFMNNTGDTVLNFNVSLISSLGTRLIINYTGNQSMNYQNSPGTSTNITIDVNTTGLTSGLYAYNLTVTSEAGTQTYEKKLNLQTAAGPYLSISIDTFSSSVTTSQTGITYAVSVTNFGTQAASNVDLSWILPSIFTLSSGNLTRSFSTLPIGSSGTNNIIINVGSSTADIYYYINATAISSNADSANTSKIIVVSNPIIITQTVSGVSGGGGGGIISGGAAGPVYSNTVEMVRGQQDSFDIPVYNPYLNSTMENLTLNITGFLPQYIEISPSVIDQVNSKETKKFTVKLDIPAYKESYEEHNLIAKINGYRIIGGTSSIYSETQNIQLIIQQISREDANLSLTEAERAVSEMNMSGFNTQEVFDLLTQAKLKLSQRRNQESQNFSKEVVDIRNQAFSVNSLITNISIALNDPRKTNLLTGGAITNFVDEKGNKISLVSLLTGKAVFSSSSPETLLEMSIAAFDRGDFATAEDRARSAQILLLLERKGNLGFFLYLYWYFVLAGFLIFSIAGVISYKVYQKSSITKKIEDIDKEEDSIKELLISSQKKYFIGKSSAEDYHSAMNQYQNNLAKIKKERINLRNKSIKMLEPMQVSRDLSRERAQVELEIEKLQERFYKENKISKEEYELGFKILNERLAEIEEEKITLELLDKNKKNNVKSKSLKKEDTPSEKKIKLKKEKSIPAKIVGFFKSPLKKISQIKENKRINEEEKIKAKIKEVLK